MDAYDEMLLQLTEERKKLSAIENSFKRRVLGETGFKTEIIGEAEAFIKHYLRLAFMWLGKCKGALGANNPYPESTNAKSKSIEPPTDLTDALIPGLLDVKKDDLIGNIKAIRNELEIVVKSIASHLKVLPQERQYQVCAEIAFENAENAKMQLGLILGGIRDGISVKKEKPAKEVKPVKESKIKSLPKNTKTDDTKGEDTTGDAGEQSGSGSETESIANNSNSGSGNHKKSKARGKAKS